MLSLVGSTGWKEVIEAVKASDRLLQATLEQNADMVADGIEKAHAVVSHLQYNDENSLSCAISLAYYSAKRFYDVMREFPSGKGYADLVFLPRPQHAKKPAISQRVNQHFVQLPFARLIQMMEYKAKERGIAVILTEESYTSGTSFLDGESPSKENYDKTRRIHRGLFRANDDRLINADVNRAFQILRKVFPNVSADGIEGVVLRPVVVVAA